MNHILNHLVLAFIVTLAAPQITCGQSYYDMVSGIISDGQYEQSQIWNQYFESMQQEQSLYRAAMYDPNCQAAYSNFLAAGNSASLEEFAVYYVRSAGGNAQAFRNFQNRTTQLNANDRNNIFSTHNYLNGINQQILHDRWTSNWNNSYAIGELLGGSATYGNASYNYQIPTNLNYGYLHRDQHGNTFTLGRDNQVYRWDGYGWEQLQYRGGN